MENTEINEAMWECANQQIYDLKREVARLTLLERDYLTEIETLQAKHVTEQKHMQIKINILEEEKRNIEQSKTKSIEEVEQALLLKDDEVRTLTERLEAALKTEPVIDNLPEIQNLRKKVQKLENENVNLKEENYKMRTCTENVEKNIQNYIETINNLRDEHNLLTENYKSKAEDLNEAKGMIDTLQDELMVAKTELEIVKSRPTETSTQGNSLFAEVDEKRLQLQTKVNRMKTHYEQMKQQITHLEDQVFKMRTENGILKRNWEKEIEERADEKYDVEVDYKNRIHSLEALIADYKRELESRPLVSTKTVPQEELSFIEYRIELKNKEIQRLLEKIDNNSFSNLVNREQSRHAVKEASRWQLKYIDMKEEVEKDKEIIAKLEEKIREMEIAGIKTNPAVSSPEIMSSLTSVINIAELDTYVDCSRLKKRSCSLLQENRAMSTGLGQCHKEDQASVDYSKKKVQFTEETKENVCRNKTYRRGGKTIICQPVVLKKREF